MKRNHLRIFFIFHIQDHDVAGISQVFVLAWSAMIYKFKQVVWMAGSKAPSFPDFPDMYIPTSAHRHSQPATL